MPRFDKEKQIVSWKGMVHLMIQNKAMPPYMKFTGLQQAEAIKPLKQIFAIQRVVAPVDLFFVLPLLLSCQVNSIVSHLDHSILCFTAICLAAGSV